MVKWGVIGCGWVAKDFVIPAIQQARNAVLIGVCDRDPDAAAGFRRLTLDQLLTSEVEAIYIATPNNSHAELTIQAAQAGKHVLCEKPMATSLSDAQRMAQACIAAGVFYGTAFDQRFHDAHRAIRAITAKGGLGDITSARIHYACWLPPDWSVDNWRIDPTKAGGGAFVDLAPHGVDLLQYLLGERIEQLVCLKQHRVFGYQVEDGGMAIGQSVSGVLIHLQVAYNCHEVFPRRTLELIGTEAMIIARDTMGQTCGGSVEMIDKTGNVTSVSFERDRSPFLNQIEVFSESLLDRRIPLSFSIEQDLHTMGLIASCL